MTNQKSYVSNKKVLLVSQKHKLNLHAYKYGGEGGIRTHTALKHMERDIILIIILYQLVQ